MKALLELAVLVYAWRTRRVRRPVFSIALAGEPTGGTWTMTYLGKTTGPIPHDATLTDIRLVAEPLGVDVTRA